MFARRIVPNRTHDTVLRFLPPYLITREHVDQAIHALDELLSQHSATGKLATGRLVAGTR
jgi:acetylornithine aminotransferase/acetylornithine/N-succinyldiaminopimelate aminotransferase